MVSLPTRSARIRSHPVPLTVAPMTLSPMRFSTGMDSPVIIDSSTALRPSITVPSVGIFSPGRTRSLSPTFTWSSGTSYSLPSSRMMRASLGERSSSARMAEPVRLRARSSSTWPEQHEHDDGGGGFEVDLRLAAVRAHGVGKNLRQAGSRPRCRCRPRPRRSRSG